MEFEAGTQVEILEHGTWIGPYTVTGQKGRTDDHLVLRTGDGTLFEEYNDAPFNVRRSA